MSKKTTKFWKYRRFLRMLAIQLILVVVFSSLLYVSRPVEEDEVKRINIVVDDTLYYYAGREDRFSIISSGVEYQFHNTGISSAYPNSKLSDTIQIGEELSISYVERYSLFDKRNSVVAAQSDTEVYRSIEEYNQNVAFLPVILLCVFVEILFLSVLTIYILFSRKRLHTPN